MLDFFQQRFSYLHQVNLAWIRHLTADEMDVSHDIKLLVSKLINDQHIRLAQFQGIDSESELLDIHAERYWEMLERANFKEWQQFIFSLASENLSSDDVLFVQLFQVLNQHAQYLGQLKLLCEQQEIDLIDENLILAV